MRILATGDFHGDFGWLPEAIDRLRPDLLLSPGDWGDPGQASPADYQAVLDGTPVLTVYGNHDDRDLLARLRNRDGSPVLLAQGEARRVGDMAVGGIGGIWAKTPLGSRLGAQWERARQRDPSLTLEAWLAGRPLPPYVTDEQVAEYAARLATAGCLREAEAIDILVAHGCPIDLADLTPTGSRGGQRCFRLAFEAIRPRLYLCGHLHRRQRADLADGRAVLNTGASGEGWLIDWRGGTWAAEPVQVRRNDDTAERRTA